MTCTPTELMTVAAARLLDDSDVCFVGIGLPSAACNLARLTHAPGVTLIYESGTIGARPTTLPLSIGDGELCETALTTVPVPEFFRYWLQGGRVTVGFLGAAQIDRFANLNTTVVGDYARPAVRLPGSGGAPDMAAACDELVVMMPHTRRGFVDRLDFVTTLGHGRGGDDRARRGFRTKGPTHVISDLCVLEPDPGTKELVVSSMHPGVTEAMVREACGWPVRFAPHVAETAPATPHELDVLRALQRRTEEAHREPAVVGARD
jgi:glutaconate CoA-transferase subunit B